MLSTVYIGIGSNLGGRKKNCLKAIDLISERIGKIMMKSSLFETEPWGVKDQPNFINMVIKIKTALDPFSLLDHLRDIELEMGRKKTFPWGPRLIDLDILFYNHDVVDSEELQIPHPLVNERFFVLKPMMEIAANYKHPILKKTIKELYEDMKFHEKIQSF